MDLVLRTLPYIIFLEASFEVYLAFVSELMKSGKCGGGGGALDVASFSFLNHLCLDIVVKE